MSTDDPSRSGRPVPAFAPARGGDDIDAARLFVESAVSGMRRLKVTDGKAVHDWLDRVEREARPLQARAIARAVDAARSDVGTSRIGDTIASVGSLIGQYEMGLVDVEVQIEAGDRILPCEDAFEISTSMETETDMPSEVEARFEEARQLLAQLMPKVDTAPHEAALDALLAFDPHGEGLSDAPSPSARVDVEALLPGLVDHAVRTARRHGKQLTTSYVAQNARIPSELAEEWKSAAEAALGALVATSVETPDRRRVRGETSAAHIAIRAEGQADGSVALRLDCPGPRAPSFDVDPPHSIETGQSEGRVWIVFTVRAETPAQGSAA